MKILILAFLMTALGAQAQVEPCGPKQSESRSTISAGEVDAWIAFFTARYFQRTADLPETKLSLSDICSYYPRSGLHEIYPDEGEQLYSIQVYVLRDSKTYRYMFSFAAVRDADDGVHSIKAFFDSALITKYYVARVDDSSNLNPLERIIKNGSTTAFSIKME